MTHLHILESSGRPFGAASILAGTRVPALDIEKQDPRDAQQDTKVSACGFPSIWRSLRSFLGSVVDQSDAFFYTLSCRVLFWGYHFGTRVPFLHSGPPTLIIQGPPEILSRTPKCPPVDFHRFGIVVWTFLGSVWDQYDDLFYTLGCRL